MQVISWHVEFCIFMVYSTPCFHSNKQSCRSVECTLICVCICMYVCVFMYICIRHNDPRSCSSFSVQGSFQPKFWQIPAVDCSSGTLGSCRSRHISDPHLSAKTFVFNASCFCCCHTGIFHLIGGCK
jgi:hypothetical protein